MVPANQILETARQHEADIIGLSGLITPSLDEMVHVAAELEREGLDIPLLIGGATTSRAHTAVKVEPKYSGPVVHVLDASRSVGVASHLLNDEKRPEFSANVRAEYAEVREKHHGKTKDEGRRTLAEARAHKHQIDWSGVTPPKPSFLGVRAFDDFSLAELTPRIDWTPFFRTWELAGTYPQILKDPVVGHSARQLFADAQAMLDRIVQQGLLEARGVVGFFPANSVGDDDIEIYADETREKALGTFHTIRQQIVKPKGRPDYALADFTAPKGSGVADYIGAFAVTTGIGVDAMVADYKAKHDDYNAILVKALADRLAEAFAERMHERVRTELWGYAPDEDLDNEALIRRSLSRHPAGARAIRPARITRKSRCFSICWMRPAMPASH